MISSAESSSPSIKVFAVRLMTPNVCQVNMISARISLNLLVWNSSPAPLRNPDAVLVQWSNCLQLTTVLCRFSHVVSTKTMFATIGLKRCQQLTMVTSFMSNSSPSPMSKPPFLSSLPLTRARTTWFATYSQAILFCWGTLIKCISALRLRTLAANSSSIRTTHLV